MIIKLKQLVLPVACALGMMAAPAFAQTSTIAPAATPAPTPAPAPGTVSPAAPNTVSMPPVSTPAANATSTTHVSNSSLGSSHRFKTVAAATAHCPSDTVIWTTGSKSKSYHLSTSKYYGKTKHGFYACKAEADTAGYHASKT